MSLLLSASTFFFFAVCSGALGSEVSPTDPLRQMLNISFPDNINTNKEKADHLHRNGITSEEFKTTLDSDYEISELSSSIKDIPFFSFITGTPITKANFDKYFESIKNIATEMEQLEKKEEYLKTSPVFHHIPNEGEITSEDIKKAMEIQAEKEGKPVNTKLTAAYKQARSMANNRKVALRLLEQGITHQDLEEALEKDKAAFERIKDDHGLILTYSHLHGRKVDPNGLSGEVRNSAGSIPELEMLLKEFEKIAEEKIAEASANTDNNSQIANNTTPENRSNNISTHTPGQNTEAHTHSLKMPLITAGVAVVVLAVATYGVYRYMHPKTEQPESAASTQ